MKYKYYSSPDTFTASPLLSILPLETEAIKLDALNTSIYARYEKVLARKEALQSSEDLDLAKQLSDEQSMLRCILDWLAANSEE